jgi:hypothetical protein
MEKEFVPYELAVKLKALGFDEDCFGYYHLNEGYTKGYAFCYFNEPKRYESDSAILTPTYSQAFRWFREKYDLIGWIEKYPLQKVYVLELPKYNPFDDPLCFNTYEEAELACLTKLIEIVEQTKN